MRLFGLSWLPGPLQRALQNKERRQVLAELERQRLERQYQEMWKQEDRRRSTAFSADADADAGQLAQQTSPMRACHLVSAPRCWWLQRVTLAECLP